MDPGAAASHLTFHTVAGILCTTRRPIRGRSDPGVGEVRAPNKGFGAPHSQQLLKNQKQSRTARREGKSRYQWSH